MLIPAKRISTLTHFSLPALARQILQGDHAESAAIRIQNGEPVEYGQTLFVIDQRNTD